MTAGTADPWIADRIRHHRANGATSDGATLHALADVMEAGALAGTMPITGPLLDLRAVAAGIAQLPTEQLRPLADALAPLLAPPTTGDYLTPMQTADLMGCTRQHVYNLLRLGHLPRHHVGPGGRRIRVRRADVTRYLEGR